MGAMNRVINLCHQARISPEDRLDALRKREGEIIGEGHLWDDAWNVLNTTDHNICERVAFAANSGDLAEVGRLIVGLMEIERNNRAINQAIKEEDGQ